MLLRMKKILRCAIWWTVPCVHLLSADSSEGARAALGCLLQRPLIGSTSSMEIAHD